MRILYQNRPEKSWIGGDMKQLRRILQEMAFRGHRVEFNDEYSLYPLSKYKEYDIVHIFNFSMSWTRFQAYMAKRAGKKVVCSMIYHEIEGMVGYADQQKTVDCVDAMVFLTKGELERARRHLKIPDEKVHFIVNGIDREWFRPWQPGSYVLCVGRIEPFKGQLEVAQACKELGLKFKCVGEVMIPQYAQAIFDAGGEIHEALEGEDLKKMYEGASVVAVMSKNELMPLVAMEAGAMGKQVILTRGCEWELPVIWANYQDVPSIKAALLEATNQAKEANDQLIEFLQPMTWENVGGEYEEVYKKILEQ